MMDVTLYESIKAAVIRSDTDSIVSASEYAAGKKDGSAETIVRGLRDGLIEAGELFDSGRISLTQMSGCSIAARAGFDALAPFYNRLVHPTVIIATIEGDRHSQGRDIIHLELSGLGFNVIDLGSDVPADTIVSECIERKADAIVTSAIMTTAMQNQKSLEEKLVSAGIRDKVITCIGGPPTSQAWADRIGADIWTRNSSGLMKRLIESFPSMQ